MSRGYWAFIAAMVIGLSAVGPTAVRAAERWESFSRPSALPAPAMVGRVAHDGALIWFATFG